MSTHSPANTTRCPPQAGIPILAALVARATGPAPSGASPRRGVAAHVWLLRVQGHRSSAVMSKKLSGVASTTRSTGCMELPRDEDQH
jgi:hypothetical protein